MSKYETQMKGGEIMLKVCTPTAGYSLQRSIHSAMKKDKYQEKMKSKIMPDSIRIIVLIGL